MREDVHWVCDEQPQGAVEARLGAGFVVTGDESETTDANAASPASRTARSQAPERARKTAAASRRAAVSTMAFKMVWRKSLTEESSAVSASTRWPVPGGVPKARRKARSVVTAIQSPLAVRNARLYFEEIEEEV